MIPRAVLGLLGLLLVSSTLSAGQPGELGGTFTGEVVVKSLSATRVVVALDEEGFGLVKHLFFVDTDRPVGPFASRSSVSRVDYSQGKLVVTVPSEHQLFLFAVDPRAARPQRRELRRERDEVDPEGEIFEGADLLVALGLETLRIEPVVMLAEYRLPKPVALADVERGELAGIGPRVPLPVKPTPQNPEPLPPDTSGCRTSCSVNCGGGSSCNLTCTNGRCGSCDCIAGHGASCSCS